MVFLLHFSKPYGKFRHYLGTASGTELPAGENPFTNIPWLMESLSSAGITYRIARTWLDRGQDWERRLRANYGGHSGPASYCPDCRGDAAFKRGVSLRRPSKYPGVKPYLRVSERDAICLQCPLDDCVGIKSPRCPIKIEQGKRRREYDKRRRPAGYRRLARINAETTAQQTRGEI